MELNFSARFSLWKGFFSCLLVKKLKKLHFSLFFTRTCKSFQKLRICVFAQKSIGNIDFWIKFMNGIKIFSTFFIMERFFFMFISKKAEKIAFFTFFTRTCKSFPNWEFVFLLKKTAGNNYYWGKISCLHLTNIGNFHDSNGFFRKKSLHILK